MQVSIARQLGLQPTTVGNFFMNARRRLHDKWQNSDYDNGAKVLLENNNDDGNAANNIMIVDNYSSANEQCLQQQHQPHDLSFALEAIESIEQPPPPVASDSTANCVYSLTSLWWLMTQLGIDLKPLWNHV